VLTTKRGTIKENEMQDIEKRLPGLVAQYETNGQMLVEIDNILMKLRFNYEMNYREIGSLFIKCCDSIKTMGDFENLMQEMEASCDKRY
jgi:hypothetical protein